MVSAQPSRCHIAFYDGAPKAQQVPVPDNVQSDVLGRSNYVKSLQPLLVDGILGEDTECAGPGLTASA